jgi:RecA-family ATPase
MDDCYKSNNNGVSRISNPLIKKVQSTLPNNHYDVGNKDYSMEEFIETCFGKDSTLLVAYPNDAKNPENIQLYSDNIDKKGDYGVWISLNGLIDNPVNDRGNLSLSSKTTNQYKFVLVDFDSASKEIQYSLIRNLKLPCTAIIDSGIRGYHCWVNVDAKNEIEFKEKSNRLHDFLEPYTNKFGIKLDRQVTNRFAGWARLGGCMRGEHKQKCVFLDKNQKSFEQWYKESTLPYLDKLIEIDSLFSDTPIVDMTTQPLIGQFLKNQSLASICSQTGLGKSVLSLQWMTCLAAGKSLMDFDFLTPVKPLKILTVQAEDDAEKIRQVITSTCKEMDYTDNEIKLAKSNIIITSQLVFNTMIEFFKTINAYCEEFKPNVIFINPLNRYFQGDFSSDHEKIALFANQLDNMAKQHNCLIFIITHTAKPSEEKKQSLNNIYDDSYAIFGSSLWASCLRNIILLERTNDDDRERILKFGKGFEDLVEERKKRIRMATPPTKVFTFIRDNTYESTDDLILEVIPLGDFKAISKKDITENLISQGYSLKTVENHLYNLQLKKKIKTKLSNDNKTKLYYKI